MSRDLSSVSKYLFFIDQLDTVTLSASADLDQSEVWALAQFFKDVTDKHLKSGDMGWNYFGPFVI